MTIHKYPLSAGITTEIRVPASAVVISAGLDPAKIPCLWVKLDKNAAKDCSVFIDCVGTGHELPSPFASFVNSFQEDQFIWHIFATYRFG